MAQRELVITTQLVTRITRHLTDPGRDGSIARDALRRLLFTRVTFLSDSEEALSGPAYLRARDVARRSVEAFDAGDHMRAASELMSLQELLEAQQGTRVAD